MSIVKMKHLHLVAMEEDQSALLKGLRDLGCVEIRQPKDLPEEWDFLVPPDSVALDRVSGQANALKNALDILKKMGPPKGKLLSPLPEVDSAAFFDEDAYAAALKTADSIDAAQRERNTLRAERSKLELQRMELAPWLELAVDLSFSGTRRTGAVFASVPRSVTREAVGAALDAVTDLYDISWAGEDKENRYFLLFYHQSVAEAVRAVLPALGGGRVNQRNRTGTARENDVILQGAMEENQRGMDRVQGVLEDGLTHWEDLRRALDRADQDIALEEARGRLRNSRDVFFLEGWAPAEREREVEALLEGRQVAYQLADPTEAEYPDVPIQLKGNAVTEPFTAVTEMYSMPAYDGVDPNPWMAPFFILFFGFMMNDIAYGLLMILGTALYLRLAKPKTGMRRMMSMFFLCGISSVFWGCLTGSFFGDFIPQLLKLLDPGSDFVWFWPPLFSPINDTILVMVGSMALGVIQIFTGMAISMAEKLKRGQIVDAVTDELSWYCILIGAALAICGMAVSGLPPVLGTVGLVVLFAGLGMLLVGNIIRAKGLGGIVGFGGAIYNGVSGYFSDILSYLRLMALMMAGSIIAQVFNTLGAVFGVASFVIIGLIGNALNLVLNLLGCYVHTLRLQCLEFFGRFYKDGGKAFHPLAVNTKYVEVIKGGN